MLKKNVFQIIDQFLVKKSHEKVLSIYLGNYNGNHIYIRFDYVNKISAYKLIWFDLNFIDLKHLDRYINSQLMTNTLANRVVDILQNENYESGYFLDDKIKGDRVEIVSYQKGEPYEFVFSRFLPKELSFLIDPIVILFSYLPRNMDYFLNEIFGKLDGVEEKYNALKPIKFDLFSDAIDSLFQSKVLKEGKRLYEEERLSFLEKINNKYIALFTEEEPVLVTLDLIEEGYIFLWCSCKHEGYCKHYYPVLKSIREHINRPFYKVKYIGKEKSLLDKVTEGVYNLCIGVEKDTLLLVNHDGEIFSVPFYQNGKLVMEVLEDDDELSLSKYIQSYQKK